MSERSDMMEWLRGEIIGPARRLSEPAISTFINGEFADATAARRGPLAWRPDPKADPEEVLYFDRESPHRKYGAGLLYPGAAVLAATVAAATPDIVALESTDTIGAEIQEDEVETIAENGADDSRKC